MKVNEAIYNLSHLVRVAELSWLDMPLTDNIVLTQPKDKVARKSHLLVSGLLLWCLLSCIIPTRCVAIEAWMSTNLPRTRAAEELSRVKLYG